MVIILIPAKDRHSDHCVIGPFPSVDIASRYGFDHLIGCEWYWLPLETPATRIVEQ